MVFASASAFMCATISTSPERGVGRDAGDEPVGVEFRRQRRAFLKLGGGAGRREWCVFRTSARHSRAPRSGEPGIHNHRTRGIGMEYAWTICNYGYGLAALGRNDASRPRLPAPIYVRQVDGAQARSCNAQRSLQPPHHRACRHDSAHRPASPSRTRAATAHSRLCGSTVTVDLKMDGDKVTDFAHEVKACALGQASSSIMAQYVVGSNADELRALRESRAQDAQGERRAAAPTANGPTSPCSSRCATTRRATPRPC